MGRARVRRRRSSRSSRNEAIRGLEMLSNGVAGGLDRLSHGLAKASGLKEVIYKVRIPPKKPSVRMYRD